MRELAGKTEWLERWAKLHRLAGVAASRTSGSGLEGWGMPDADAWRASFGGRPFDFAGQNLPGDYPRKAKPMSTAASAMRYHANAAKPCRVRNPTRKRTAMAAETAATTKPTATGADPNAASTSGPCL